MTDPTRDEVAGILARWDHSREHILSILQDIQHVSSEHHVSQEVAAQVAADMGMTPTAVYEIVTFYHMLHAVPHGRHRVEICESTPCFFQGGDVLQRTAAEQLGVAVDEATPDGAVRVETVPCFGRCATAPNVKIDDRAHQRVSPAALRGLIDRLVADDRAEQDRVSRHV
ncbi:NAD(P)H-dependent oxidoreductase subunit E [uncultured Propionibacterium sp.]|uniref:NADH-quinone oxidoreductase subunit NuoE family protein n=1 Tax=uncultured Propionibacterium sp. TaxID=218066 RepID=UPI00292FACC4|nr:NAD(P)H-dependent oxidoreductase subunit E [uncultured Propionibacterium sp.]